MTKIRTQCCFIVHACALVIFLTLAGYVSALAELGELIDIRSHYHYVDQKTRIVLEFNQKVDYKENVNSDRITLHNHARRSTRCLFHQAVDRDKFCSARRPLSLLIMAAQTFIANGYVLVGMQHFVRPHDALCEVQKSGELRRNFQGYSRCFSDDLLGIGVSALSSVGNFYTQNEQQIDAYYRRLNACELPLVRGFLLTDDDKLRRYMIMQIICNLRLDFAELLRRFNVVFMQHFSSALPKLVQMSQDGLLKITNDQLCVTQTGRSMVRNICMLFDAYLAPEQELAQSQMH